MAWFSMELLGMCGEASPSPRSWRLALGDLVVTEWLFGHDYLKQSIEVSVGLWMMKRTMMCVTESIWINDDDIWVSTINRISIMKF